MLKQAQQLQTAQNQASSSQAQSTSQPRIIVLSSASATIPDQT